MDYLRYYFPILLQTSALAGILAGGPWVWFGILQLPALALVDGFFPYDSRTRKASSEPLMDVPLVASVLLGYVILVTVALRASAPEVSGFELTGMILSAGLLTGVTILPATHQLYHKR